METDKKFIDGLFVKKPSNTAPSFIKGKISFKKDKFVNWLNLQQGEWVNVDILESQKGEYYAKVDEWKPNQEVSKEQGEEIKNMREEHNQKSDFDSITPENIPF